jgi:hypothetical protein
MPDLAEFNTNCQQSLYSETTSTRRECYNTALRLAHGSDQVRQQECVCSEYNQKRNVDKCHLNQIEVSTVRPRALVSEAPSSLQ